MHWTPALSGLLSVAHCPHDKSCSSRGRPAPREGMCSGVGSQSHNGKIFHFWDSAEIQSSGAVQCEVFNWICLAADQAHEIISGTKLKKGNLIT